MRYTGRRVNPHLLRDIFAVKWLEDHPEDYLTLSKILWHRNIQTTLQIYGAGFDESHGARRVDDWREQRRKSGLSAFKMKREAVCCPKCQAKSPAWYAGQYQCNRCGHS